MKVSQIFISKAGYEKIYKIRIVLLMFLLMGCVTVSDNSPEKMYEEFMNMEVPKNIKNLKGEGEINFPMWTSSGYFTYQADNQYFEILLKNDKFIDNSEFNMKIKVVSYKYLNDTSFQFWLKDTKLEKPNNIDKKKIYKGIYVPYIHYLLRDTITNKVYHFVEGMRE